MKRMLGGKLYDTKTADLLLRQTNDDGFIIEWYRTPGGRYFRRFKLKQSEYWFLRWIVGKQEWNFCVASEADIRSALVRSKVDPETIGLQPHERA